MKHQQKMLSAAIEFASECHKGQFDRSGAPYILHPLKIMHYLKTDDEELNCCGVLHDTIEDRFIGKEKELSKADAGMQAGIKALKQIGMTERVIRCTTLLTKVPWKSDDDYYEELAWNWDAVRVKRVDLRHNMDIRRLKGLTEKDFQRMADYAQRWAFLETADLRHGFSKAPKTFAPLSENNP